jgi:hypothetical protein
MPLFTVIFQIESTYYDNEQYNLVGTVQKEYQAESLEALQELLDDPESLNSVDDFDVFHPDCPDPPDEITLFVIQIVNEEGSVVFDLSQDAT